MNKKSFLKIKRFSSFLIMLSMMLTFFPVLPASAASIGGYDVKTPSLNAGASTTYTVYVDATEGIPSSTDFSLMFSGADFRDCNVDVSVDGYSYQLKTGASLDKQVSYVSFQNLEMIQGPLAIITVSGAKNPTIIGDLNFKAFVGSDSSFKTLTIVPSEPTKLEITPSTQTTTADVYASVTVGVYDAYGNPATINQNVYVTGNDPLRGFSKYTVTYPQRVAGTYEITAKTDGIADATASIKIEPADLFKYNVTLKGTIIENSLDEVETGKIAFVAKDFYGNTNPTTAAKQVYFTSNNTSIKFFDASNKEIASAVGIPYVASGEVFVKGNVSTDNDTFNVTVSDKVVSTISDPYAITKISKLAKTEVDVPANMIVNERYAVKIAFEDLSGKPFVDTVDQSIGLTKVAGDTSNGLFFNSVAKDNQTAITSASIKAGTSVVTVWYQPLSVGKHQLKFTSTYNNVYSTIDVVGPAGQAYIDSSVDWNGRVVSEQASPTPDKLTFTLKDQYGNDQTSATARNLIFKLENNEDGNLDGNVKFYYDENCTLPLTDNNITVAANAVSATVYAISTVAGEFFVSVTAENIYTVSESFYFKAGDPEKAAIVAYGYDGSEITTHIVEPIALKVVVKDKYDNEISYYNENPEIFYDSNNFLTARLSTNLGLFTSYSDDYYGSGSGWFGSIITQIKVNEKFMFLSQTPGTATITATLPEPLTVEPLTITVSDERFNFDVLTFDREYNNENDTLINYVRPGWRVPVYSYFYGGTVDAVVYYQAYTMQNGIKTAIGSFYANEWTGESLDPVKSEWNDIYFEVPTDLAEETVIYIEATPNPEVSAPKVKEIVVKSKEDWGRNWLNRGWNILSTPFALSNNNILNIIEKPEYVQVAYGFKNGQWVQMTTADMNTMTVKPLEAYYIKVKGETGALYYGLSTPTVPPIKTLNAGWNFVSPALDVNDSDSKAVKDAFYTVWDSTKLFVSPVFNHDGAWSVVNTEATDDVNENNSVYAGYGYWMFLGESADLAGFSTTPVRPVGSYGWDW